MFAFLKGCKKKQKLKQKQKEGICDRESMWPKKALNIYCLDLYRKSLLNPGLEHRRMVHLLGPYSCHSVCIIS